MKRNKQRKKRIGLVLSAPPESGGEFQYEKILVEILFSSNYDVTVLCNNRIWIKWCKEKKVRFVKVDWGNHSEIERRFGLKFPLLYKIYSSYFTDIGVILRRENICLLVCGTQSLYLPNLFIRTIRPVHDLMHRYETRFEEIRSTWRERELFFQTVVKFSDVILTDSQLGKKQLIESYLKNKKKRPQIEVLPFVAPFHIMESEEEYVEIPDKYIFYPAQFWQHKNHINLIKAILILKDRIPDIRLVLVGSEKNNLKRIKKFIEAKQLEDYITILGFVTNKQITFLYKHAVAMVMPSYLGPTNIPPLEAMVLGCPVLVSNNYAMPEQVGDAGLAFNPDSPEEIAGCIEKVWNDGTLRENMVKKGYLRVNKWKLEDFKEKLLSIIEKNM